MSSPSQSEASKPDLQALNNAPIASLGSISEEPSASSSSTPAFKVYKPPTTTASLPTDELTDADFTPTTAELQAAYASQKHKLDTIVNAPLKTQSIQEREAKAKANRWPKTTLRIKFPNQLIIERTFDSSEKIKAAYQFVRSALIQDAITDKFILYQAPRRELKVSDPAVKTLSLYEIGLAPSSVLLVKFQTEAYNSTVLPPPLLPQILGQAIDLPGTEQAGERDIKPSGNGPITRPPPQPSSEKKIPKWFKMGNQKK